jgi:N-acetylglucosamine-1-phosphodiester alpha-N-acetylglucosaminidase
MTLTLFTLAVAVGSASALLPTPRDIPLRSASGGDDLDVFPWRSAPFSPLVARSWNGSAPHTGRAYTGHVGIVQDSSQFSFELPANGCKIRNNVSAVAPAFGCTVATNGGFFSFAGACEGDAIINGSTVIWGGEDRAVFGVVPGKKSTMIGYVSNSTVGSYGFYSLLSGLGFLVRNGANYVNSSHEFQPSPGGSSFVTEKAPRTAVGVTADGSLFLAVVDGIEVLGVGPDLYEFADILIQEVGAQAAINLDGGGSSDMTYEGQIFSRPTCEDQPEPICERPVTTIACIRGQ